MTASNHYNTLNVSPNATSDEIKKAYRKLALRYHPDVANNDPIAEEKFRDIKTAYDVLSNSKHRQDYHYKLFYTQIKTNPVVTATSIANQSEDLLQFTKALDPYRLDTESLYNQISLLINDNNQSILLSVRNPTLIEGIVLNLLHCSQLLPLDSALSIHKILLTLADKNEKLLAIINKQTQWQKLLHYWDKYKLLLALAIAITLCIIFFKLV